MISKFLIAIALILLTSQSAQAGMSYEPPVEGGPAETQGSGTR